MPDWIVVDDAVFPIGQACLLWTFVSYIRDHSILHHCLDDFVATFNEDAWDSYIPDPPIEEDRETKVIYLSDYPKFNGKVEQWPEFYNDFREMATVAGYGTMFVDDPEHDKKFLEDETYKKECQHLYNVLKVVCVKGSAYGMVQGFNQTKDFRMARRYLKARYNSIRGMNDQVALDETVRLELYQSSEGGLERYIAEFKRFQQQLQDSDLQFTESQYLTIFRARILNPRYEDDLKTSKMANLTLDETIDLLRNVQLQQISNATDQSLTTNAAHRHRRNSKRMRHDHRS